MNSRRRGRPPHPDLLTPAEWSVLRYVRGRLSYAQIALGRRVSRDAVKQHVRSIRSKLGLASREELQHWRGQPGEHPNKRPQGQQNSPGSETMPVNRIDLLINVQDVERALIFYRDLIGMKLDATCNRCKNVMARRYAITPTSNKGGKSTSPNAISWGMMFICS